MRVLVCGTRAPSADMLDRVSEDLACHRPKITVLITGDARGVDTCVAEWTEPPCQLLVFRARWQEEGLRAGPIRNQRMLVDGKPERGLAFGPLWKRDMRGTWRVTGTGDMVRRMLRAGLPVRWCATPIGPGVDLTEMPAP